MAACSLASALPAPSLAEAGRSPEAMHFFIYFIRQGVLNWVPCPGKQQRPCLAHGSTGLPVTAAKLGELLVHETMEFLMLE